MTDIKSAWDDMVTEISIYTDKLYKCPKARCYQGVFPAMVIYYQDTAAYLGKKFDCEEYGDFCDILPDLRRQLSRWRVIIDVQLAQCEREP